MLNQYSVQTVRQISVFNRNYNKYIVSKRYQLSHLIKNINNDNINETIINMKKYDDDTLSAMYQNDNKLYFFKESLYPLAKFSLAAGLVFSFTLIQVVLPYVAVVSFLLFSSAFFVSNLYQKGGILCLLTTVGVVTFPVSSPILLATCALLLCGFAVYRGYLRSEEAKGVLNKEIDTTINTILMLEKI